GPDGAGGRQSAGPEAGCGRLKRLAFRALEQVRAFETRPGLVGTSESVEDLAFRPPRHGQGGVCVQEGIVVAEGLDESCFADLRRGRGSRLAPTSREGRRVGGSAQDVLDLEAILVVFRRVQVRGFREGVRGFLRSPQLPAYLRR